MTRAGSERGTVVLLVFCAMAAIGITLASVGLRFDAAAGNRHREAVRLDALWLARSGITSPGAREATIDRAHLRLATQSSGARRQADALADGFGRAHVEASIGADGRVTSWSETWTATPR